MFAENRRRAIEILLVEDSHDDAAFILAALGKVVPDRQLHWAQDADEALDRVHRRGDHAGLPPPDLVLLDLHLPGRGGYRLLDALKGEDTLRATPVVVISGSDDPQDINDCYAARANSFVRKPSNTEEFDELIDAVRTYWLETVQLPIR